jgi:hypothetical protein
VDGEACPDDICVGGMQHPAHVHSWLLLEGPQQQPCKSHIIALHFLLPTDLCALLHLVLNFFFLGKIAELCLAKFMCFVASSTEPFFPLEKQLKFIGVGA